MDLLHELNDPWANKLYAAWGDENRMGMALARFLGSTKERLLSDGNGGRVIISAATAHGNVRAWRFRIPGEAESAPNPVGRPLGS